MALQGPYRLWKSQKAGQEDQVPMLPTVKKDIMGRKINIQIMFFGVLEGWFYGDLGGFRGKRPSKGTKTH